MKRFLPLLALLALSPFLLFAQSNFQPGVVVNFKGDTLRGFIDYREWENNPETILFKQDASANPVTLSPGDIRYFSAQVGHLAEFVSYSGPVSADNTNTAINKMGIGRDTNYKRQTVFLKVLQEGKNMIIFSYTDALKTRFFLANALNAPPTELVYRVYWNKVQDDGLSKTVYEQDFKGQLYDAAVKLGMMTPALKKKIKDADYKEEDIQNIAGIINGISATDTAKNNPTKIKGAYKAIGIAVIGAVIVWVITQFHALHSR